MHDTLQVVTDFTKNSLHTFYAVNVYKDFSFRENISGSLDPPSLPANLTKHKDVIEDNPIILHCPAIGTPRPVIMWYKDNILVSGNEVCVTVLYKKRKKNNKFHEISFKYNHHVV